MNRPRPRADWPARPGNDILPGGGPDCGPSKGDDVTAMADAAFDFEHFIALDRQSIRVQLAAGAVLLAVGALSLFGAFGGLVQPGAANIEMITKAAGGAISLAGLFPFNNCWARWERIKTLRAIRRNLSGLDPDILRVLLGQLYAKFLGV